MRLRVDRAAGADTRSLAMGATAQWSTRSWSICRCETLRRPGVRALGQCVSCQNELVYTALQLAARAASPGRGRSGTGQPFRRRFPCTVAGEGSVALPFIGSAEGSDGR
jgi:hypothetical protein